MNAIAANDLKRHGISAVEHLLATGGFGALNHGAGYVFNWRQTVQEGTWVECAFGILMERSVMCEKQGLYLKARVSGLTNINCQVIRNF